MGRKPHSAYPALLAAALCVVALWHFAKRPPAGSTEESLAVPLASPEPSSHAAGGHIAEVSPLDRLPAPAPSAAVPAKPRGNIIEYEVVDGYAVAYGDVLLGKPTADSTASRGAYEAPTPQLWDHPEIPYVISPDLQDPARVEKALEYFRGHTPVRFIPYPGQGDGIAFEPGTNHCYSQLGRVGGLQPIKLSPGCQTAEIIHEIMHALGFVHEQSRPDRDQYVDVLWANIEDEYKPQYNVVPETFTAAIRGSSFDFHSAMLYRTDTFARQPSSPTMRSKTGEAIAPVARGLSEGDVARLNRLYRFQE